MTQVLLNLLEGYMPSIVLALYNVHLKLAKAVYCINNYLSVGNFLKAVQLQRTNVLISFMISTLYSSLISADPCISISGMVCICQVTP